jgi:hypothetical protein
MVNFATALRALINRKIKNKICGADDLEFGCLRVTGRADAISLAARCPPVT